MKRIFKGLTAILFGSIICGIAALASSNAAVMRTYTGESSLSVYIKGADLETEDLNIQIATTAAEQYSLEPISGLDRPMRTLVMLDNSLSISEKNRGKTAQILQNLIADRMNGEEISIATFGDTLNVLTDYTDDYTALKQAIDSITYQNQVTYLTDVLYELISERYTGRTEDIYERIIIIADGVDNESLGYTKEELYSLLEKYPVPVYTIGCINKKNNGELENMFALSRMTSAEYFLLDEIEDPLSVEEVLKGDRDIVRVVITPSKGMMDGSKKTVRITAPDDVTLTVEAVMPQVVAVSEGPSETITEENSETLANQPESVTVEAETQAVATGVEEPGKSHAAFPFVVMVLAAVIVAVLVVCIVLLTRKQKKDTKDRFEVIDEDDLKRAQRAVTDADEKTVMVDTQDEKRGNTVIIMNQNSTCQIVLTDIHSPVKTFRVPLSGSVVVGFKQDVCDIVLDYDRSVSRRHCEITVNGNKFYIKDLQSANGTFINGNRILAETEIFSGDVLKLGRLELRFEVR